MTKINILDTVTQSLLNPVNLDEHILQNVLGQAMSQSIDHADIFMQASYEESWFLEEDVVKEGHFSIDRGFGLRVISGEKMGFAYSDEITLAALSQAAKSARSIAYTPGVSSVKLATASHVKQLYPTLNPIGSMSEKDKVNLLYELNSMARKIDPRVKQVMGHLSGVYDVILVMNSDGSIAADIRPLVYLSIHTIVEKNGQREQGFAGGGARSGYEIFTPDTISQFVHKAVRQGLQNLEAKPAPAGTMPVVVGPGWPAVLLHEAIGHGLEGDFNRKRSSAFTDKVGQKVASELCTIVDDGTIPGRRGSLSVDDEGTPSQCTVLIEKGILKGYLQDRHNAQVMGVKPTGNGRRESYADVPLPRMTNTYMLPGQSDPGEIIASVKKGIYAVDFSGGQVDITSGKFVFMASEAYLIENGKISHPIKGAAIIGNGPDILTKVSMVGNDLQLDPGLGTCGKAGQTVPVGVGQPTLKLDAITVGGSHSE